MKIIYQHYSPDRGLENQQADVYMKASGLPADAEEIKRRFKGEKRDPQSARYALTEEGQLLAYVQVSKWVARPGTYIISYPWAVPECPPEVKEQIFDELLAWLVNTVQPQVITGEVVYNTPTTDDRTAFFLRKGFIEQEYLFEDSIVVKLEDVANWEISEHLTSYTCRIGTAADLNQILEVLHADNYMRDVFPSVEEATYYIEETFLKDPHNKLIFKNNQLVSMGLPYRKKITRGKMKGKEVIGFRSATRSEYLEAWRYLLIEIAREGLDKGWNELPLQITSLFFSYSINAIHLAQMQGGLELMAVLYSYPLDQILK